VKAPEQSRKLQNADREGYIRTGDPALFICLTLEADHEHTKSFPSAMALAPFNMVFDPCFGGLGSRDLRAGNRAMDTFTSALIPAFELPVQQGPSTAMVSDHSRWYCWQHTNLQTAGLTQPVQLFNI
jgi:hypothetical protein